MARRTDDEVMALLRGNSALNAARAALSGEIGRAEQAGMQRRCPSPIELRRMEFEAVERLAPFFAALREPSDA